MSDSTYIKVELDGAPVRIYDPEKTLADSFRYRELIGMDVVLEAMRRWRERRRKMLGGRCRRPSRRRATLRRSR